MTVRDEIRSNENLVGKNKYKSLKETSCDYSTKELR